MRSRKFSIFIFLAIGLLFIAFSGSHPTGPNGYTGAPGDGVCSQCHGSQSSIIDGDITINGLPATVSPNTTYNLTITNSITSGNPMRTGFQVVAINDANNANAGDWTNNSSNSSLKTASGKEYFGHQPAVMFNGNTSISWDADWTSPATNMDVTLYAVANLANGSGSGGDRIKFIQANTSVMGAGNPLICDIFNDVGVSCFGAEDGSAEVLITGGQSPFNILWDNGEVTAIATNLDGGTHTVMVTDDTNMTCTQTIVINEPSDIITAISSNDVSCLGASDGSATLNPSGGVPGYTYNWSIQNSGNTISNVPAGTYFATITDATFCEDMVEVTIGGPTGVDIITNTEINVTCNGEADGVIDVIGAGGTPGYLYSWSNGNMSPTNSNLGPGNYTVIITDQNMCEATQTYTITEPTLLTSSTNTTNESAAGANDGSATAEGFGGTPPYDFLWSTGDVTPTINNLAPNTYSVVVTDQNGCESTATAVVNPGGCSLVLSASSTDVDCFGENTGAVDLIVTGGSASTQFSWSNNTSSEDLINVPAGDYTVVVTDGVCEESITVSITEPDSILVVQSTTDNLCSADTVGEIILEIAGGSNDYSILWSNGVTNDSTFVIIDTPGNIIDTLVNIPDTLSDLSTGIYSYILTDGNGCNVLDTLEILFSDTESPIAEFNDVNVYLDEDGVANPVFEDEFIGTSSDNCGIESVNFVSGAYLCSDISQFYITATLVDSSGNATLDSFLVTVIDTLPPSIICEQTDITINNCDAFFYVMPTASDNCSVQSLELTSGLPSGSVFPSGTTLVEYTAIDDCGFASTCSFNVTVDIDFSATAELSQLSCPSANDGSLIFTPTGGTPPYNYTVMPGGLSGTIQTSGETILLTNLGPAEYNLFIEDSATCNFSFAETINNLPKIDVELISITNESGVGINDGAIDIAVFGGVGDVSVEWTDSNGAFVSDLEDVSNLPAGTYTLTLMDDCEVFSISYTIDVISSSTDLDEEDALVALSPNPANSFLNIVSKIQGESEFQIFTIDGELVYRNAKLQAEHNLNIGEFTPGLYLIRIHVDEKIIIKRFLKI